VKKFNKSAPTPRFKGDWEKKLSQYSQGLTILHSDQCPPVAQWVKEIGGTAEKIYGIKPKIVELRSCQDAQNSPCACGGFCIVYNGKVAAEAPVSNRRFTNIMNKELKR
jgi:hypothetical protein